MVRARVLSALLCIPLAAASRRMAGDACGEAATANPATSSVQEEAKAPRDEVLLAFGGEDVDAREYGRYERSRVAEVFGALGRALGNAEAAGAEEAEEGSEAEGAVQVPGEVGKDAFELAFALSEEEPRGVSEFSAGAFARVLEAAVKLEVEGVHAARLFRNMCARGLLDTHAQAQDILGTKMYEASGVARGSAVYAQLMKGLVDMGAQVLGLEARVLGAMAQGVGIEYRRLTLCASDEAQREQYGKVVESAEDMRVVAELKITAAALSRLAGLSVWDAVRWVFWHTDMMVLDVSGCKLDGAAMEGICRVEGMQGLNASGCGLSAECVAVLASSAAVKKSLSMLMLSNNALGVDEVAQVSKMNLECLIVIDCGLTRECIAMLAESAGARKNLKMLGLSGNALGADEVALLAKLKLCVLAASNCGLGEGSLVSLGGSESARENLKALVVSRNKLGAQDIESLAKLGLRVLDVSWCELGEGSLAALGESETVRENMHVLIALGNKLGEADAAAVAVLKEQGVLQAFLSDENTVCGSGVCGGGACGGAPAEEDAAEEKVAGKEADEEKEEHDDAQ
jgi:hypothetical protein